METRGIPAPDDNGKRRKLNSFKKGRHLEDWKRIPEEGYIPVSL